MLVIILSFGVFNFFSSLDFSGGYTLFYSEFSVFGACTGSHGAHDYAVAAPFGTGRLVLDNLHGTFAQFAESLLAPKDTGDVLNQFSWVSQFI